MRPAGPLPAPPPESPRAPAVPVAFACGAGIAVDRYLIPDQRIWLAVGGGLCLAAVTTALLRRGRSTAVTAASATLLLWFCLGGLRHHAADALRRNDNITAYLPTTTAPVRLIGRLQTPLAIDAAEHSAATPVWTQIDRTVAVLACQRIGPFGREQTVSGNVRLIVTGHLLGPEVGDSLTLLGTLQRPRGQMNPGGFDFARYLRLQGQDAVLRVEHPDHVQVSAGDFSWLDGLSRWRARLRREAEWLFVQRLDAGTVPLATSLLLGDRTGIEFDIARDFAESGTMHLLAISGLNVAIMAGLVLLVCRWLQTGPRTTTWVLLLMVLGYAWLTDQRPPVMRAALLAVIVLTGRARGCDAGGYQSLALCALAILLYRPTDLFDAGAQLSFLAVLAIVWSSRWIQRRDARRIAAQVPAVEESLVRRFAVPVSAALEQAWVMTGCIWLATLPLTLWHFHLGSPVGLLVNVLLVPLTTVMLALGYAMLLLGLAHPLLAVLPAWGFEQVLHGLLQLIRVGAATPLGHLWGPGPPTLWLTGFYLLLSLAVRFPATPLPVRRVWQALAIWTVAGLAVGLIPPASHGLRATFLAVGHGGSVLIETPSGETLLYDAGSIADGRRAEQVIQGALWARQRRALNGVIVSHADVDHFNGLPGLISTVPIGSILLTQSCLDFRQRPVVDLCEAAAQHGVPLRCVQRGDRLRCDPDVVCEVLHPTPGERFPADNANSIVLRITYAGRTLLLTGDLEAEGLQQLLARPAERTDILLSPHHGSRAANPPALAAWANPRWVIVSSDDDAPLTTLRTTYARADAVWATADCGAITVQITPGGDLTVERFEAATTSDEPAGEKSPGGL